MRGQMPRIFLASPSAFIESSCLPALCAASPSARSCLTLAASASASLGLLASLASIAFISFGQLWAKALPAARASAVARRADFIGDSLLWHRPEWAVARNLCPRNPVRNREALPYLAQQGLDVAEHVA